MTYKELVKLAGLLTKADNSSVGKYLVVPLGSTKIKKHIDACKKVYKFENCQDTESEYCIISIVYGAIPNENMVLEVSADYSKIEQMVGFKDKYEGETRELLEEYFTNLA